MGTRTDNQGQQWQTFETQTELALEASYSTIVRLINLTSLPFPHLVGAERLAAAGVYFPLMLQV